MPGSMFKSSPSHEWLSPTLCSKRRMPEGPWEPSFPAQTDPFFQDFLCKSHS